MQTRAAAARVVRGGLGSLHDGTLTSGDWPCMGCARQPGGWHVRRAAAASGVSRRTRACEINAHLSGSEAQRHRDRSSDAASAASAAAMRRGGSGEERRVGARSSKTPRRRAQSCTARAPRARRRQAQRAARQRAAHTQCGRSGVERGTDARCAR
eukprot:354926-Chlamydomonas_euryale.AAC.5